MAYTNPWSHTDPLGTQNANTIDDELRKLRLDIYERLHNNIVVDWTTDPVVPKYSNVKVSDLKIIQPPAPGISVLAVPHPTLEGFLFTHNLALAAGVMPDPSTHILLAFHYQMYKLPAPPFAVNWTCFSGYKYNKTTTLNEIYGHNTPGGSGELVIVSVELQPNNIQVIGHIHNYSGAASDFRIEYKAILMEI